MKTKLTVTVDRELLPAAKRVARGKGVSLSSLIEQALRDLIEPERPGFVDRWRGGFRLSERDEERYRALVEKYR
jgi:post-segregation antitoxin (ccd killing protein)